MLVIIYLLLAASSGCGLETYIILQVYDMFNIITRAKIVSYVHDIVVLFSNNEWIYFASAVDSEANKFEKLVG